VGQQDFDRVNQRRTTMANTELTKGNGRQVQRPADIFGAMRSELDHMFEQFEHGWPRWSSMLSRRFPSDLMLPELDVHESDKQFTIECDLPGVDEKDVSVTLANGMLTIKGEKKSKREEKNENYSMAERSYGAFERSLPMPDTIDENKLEAKFDKGVLKIVAPKKPEAIKAEKKIEIKKG
jgi:HSP20 family protein